MAKKNEKFNYAIIIMEGTETKHEIIIANEKGLVDWLVMDEIFIAKNENKAKKIIEKVKKEGLND